MIEPSWTSVLPSFLAIGLALATRQVYIALFAGIWLGVFLLAGNGVFGSLSEAIDTSLAVLASPGDARVIVFTLVIGAFIFTLERNGAVTGFVRLLERSRWVNSEKRTQWMAFIIGIVIFIESNITVLVAGTVSKPLFDRFKIAREKLAYIIDSTSAPICILIPLNAWGAFNLGLLDGLGVEQPLTVLISAIPMNLYAISAVLLTAYSIATNYNPPAMAKAIESARANADEQEASDSVASSELLDDNSPPRALNMIIPIMVLVVSMPIGLYITGNGDLLAGSGSKSVLWASLLGLMAISVLALIQRNMGLTALTTTWMEGAGRMLPLATIMLLSLALGSVAKELNTGVYIASLIGDSMAVWLLPAIIFITAGVIAFSVGTSWGTFSIMLPIALPVAAAINADPALFVAAVLSGGIFGDHASPISDTTIVSSLAAGTEHIDHVKTQMPYALRAGGVTVVGFIILGFLML